jgi:FkbM family methyltransferase
MADILFRSGTWDEDIWRCVTSNNEYRIGIPFQAEDVILDVGAHIGAFSYFALDRGAGKVFAFEPEPGNFLYLRHNIHEACRATDRAVFVSAAVWRSDRAGELAKLAIVGSNTGGNNSIGREGIPVATIPFDAAVDLALASTGRESLRLVKMDCEGAEWPILLTTHRWNRIDALVGEYHTINNPADWPAAAVEGYAVYNSELLEKVLKRYGYETIVEHGPGLGKFWAWKPGREIV